MEQNFYRLPELKFEYGALEPFISRDQLILHHKKHHQAYVDNANNILVKLEEARKADQKIDMKAICKDLSFNVAGHILHKIFWEVLAPPINLPEKPQGGLKIAIKSEFGSFERFKKEFSQAASSVEGSGWAILSYCKSTKRLMIFQVEKHNVNIVPGFPILMALDVWEHAYYLDYENERGKFVEAFWNILNWEEVSKRLVKVTASQSETQRV